MRNLFGFFAIAFETNGQTGATNLPNEATSFRANSTNALPRPRPPNCGKIIDKSSVGHALGSFFLYDYAGLDANGQMLYYKADGSKVTQDALVYADRKYVGSVLPNATYGLSFGMNYKNFDVTVDTYGTLGSKVYNGKKAQRFSGENIEDSIASDFWTAQNTGASNPAAFNQVPVASTYYLESGNFFRVNNITVGYKLPEFTKYISYARVYFNAINPFIVKKFSGFSPELS